LAWYGNVARSSLLDIWRGEERRRLEATLEGGAYPRGCAPCAAEVAAEGWDGSYPATFRARRRSDEPVEIERWPAWIDFNLSNACNLQCIQCSGELSSAIRTHRERRPPLPQVYDDRFFDDLRWFVPHLEGAHFAGGEPFLAPENFRVWSLIEELHPDLPVTVTTNGTVLTTRVERQIERLRFSFVVSLDAISPERYRSIRVGGELDPVLANVDRLRAYAVERGTTVTINHCLMVQNHHEFADLLLWAEAKGLHVDVSVVRAPTSCSIARLPADQLARVHGSLAARDAEMRSALVINRQTWVTELHRIGTWAAGAATGSDELEHWGETVVSLPRAGSGPATADGPLAELAAFADGGIVHRLEVGADDLVRSCSPSFVAAHPEAAEAMVGRYFDAIGEVGVQLFGPVVRHQDLGADDDRRDLLIRFGSTDLRIAMVALRGADGVATHGEILVAIREGSSAS
jgi:molybdenum cofactor biosynthesis enzyme MoaA